MYPIKEVLCLLIQIKKLCKLEIGGASYNLKVKLYIKNMSSCDIGRTYCDIF